MTLKWSAKAPACECHVRDAPGISRTLLITRLRELQRSGIIDITPNPNGHGSVYRPTEAGRELRGVLTAIGRWAEQWLELGPEHVDPGLLLHSWCRHSLAHERVPDRRVVVRFDFPDQPHKANQFWFIIDGDRSEICRSYPGFAEDVVVTADAHTLTEWHLGRIAWTDAIRSGKIRVSGPRSLARALPTWNRGAHPEGS